MTVTQQQDFPGAIFKVVVASPDGSKTEHSVHISRSYFEELTNGAASVETVIIQSFHFLLEREPKESILAEFDLPVISRYFPEYEATIQKEIGHF